MVSAALPIPLVDRASDLGGVRWFPRTHAPAARGLVDVGQPERVLERTTQTQVVRFAVRDWLAEEVGCAPEELAVIERRNERFDGVFSRKGERYGEAYLLVPQVEGGWRYSVALIAAWKPGRWVQRMLEPGTQVDW